jgi:hypothetical protein
MASLRTMMEEASKKTSPPLWVPLCLRLAAFVNRIRAPFINFFGRRKWREFKRSPATARLHLGCGKKARYFPNFLNCDMTPHKKVDLIMDCGRLDFFEDRSVHLIYSHAFFEHLYLRQHPVFLGECYRTLRPDGVMITLGTPDFAVVAREYLNKSDVLPTRKFDLEMAYWLTHGAPEMDALSWLSQLHKALFDRNYLLSIYQKIGFKEVRIFNYRYKDEFTAHNLGVLASPEGIEGSSWEILSEFAHQFARPNATAERVENESIWKGQPEF